MREIDIVDCFRSRNIEGIDASELLKAFHSKSDVFRFDGRRTVIHIPSNRKIILSCAGKYFEPRESYYKVTETSSCRYASAAYETQMASGNCNQCIAHCIAQGLKIRPSKIVVFKDYFKK